MARQLLSRRRLRRPLAPVLLSYEPNPNWDRRYAAQPHVLAYLNAVADKYDIRRHVRFNSEVTSSSWRDTDLKWSVRLASGEELVTDILISAVGQLSRPSLPAINGIGSFMGPGFHSASWDHTVDLRGLRVAVIGTGASAIQFVPAIQPDVGTMTVFQRTAPYILPRWDSTYGPRHHRLFHLLPLLQRERDWVGGPTSRPSR